MTIFKSLSYAISCIFIMLFFFVFIKQKYKRSKFFLISLIVITALILSNNLRLYMFPDNNVMYVLITLIQIILIQVVAFLTSETRDSKAIFTSLCGSNYVSIGTVIGIILFIYTEKIVLALFVDVVINIVVIAVMYFTIRKEYISLCDDKNMKSWWELCLVPALFYTNIIFIIALPTPLYLNPNNILGIITLLFTMIVSYTVIFHYIQGERNRSEIYRKNELFEYYIKGLESHYETVEKSEQNLKILRHDMRHYTEIIRSLLDKKEYKAAKDIIKHIDIIIKDNRVKKYCDNLKINAIVSKLMERAVLLDISMDVNMHIPIQLPFSDIELAGVMANIMENSINAVKNMDKKERNVTLMARYIDKCLVIEIKNKYEDEIIFNSAGNLPLSKKGDGHGIGLQSVSAFSYKIGGNFDCYCSDNVFTLRLFAKF